MRLPVALLALGAVGIGFAGPRIAALLGVIPEEHALLSMIPAVAVVLAGVVVAWLDFGRGTATQRRGFIASVPALHTLFSNQWYVDAVYRAVLVRLANAVARLLNAVETRGLDGGFNNLGLGVLRLGHRSTRIQSGWVQFYSGCAIIFLGAIAFYIGAR
jgi:NADH:ubiquinone oxidoreductase subunit 5 (subunit L)/multisubunit Na+/H+ antiporter MnhA subunit